MSTRDREVVDEYRKVLQKSVEPLPLEVVNGDWYVFEKEGLLPWVDRLTEEDKDFIIQYHYERGWKATPVVITKIVISR